MRTTRFCFVAMLMLLGVGGGLQPATAAEGAKCSATFVIILDPGFSAEPSTGAHRSEHRASSIATVRSTAARSPARAPLPMKVRTGPMIPTRAPTARRGRESTVSPSRPGTDNRRLRAGTATPPGRSRTEGPSGGIHRKPVHRLVHLPGARGRLRDEARHEGRAQPSGHHPRLRLAPDGDRTLSLCSSAGRSPGVSAGPGG